MNSMIVWVIQIHNLCHRKLAWDAGALRREGSCKFNPAVKAMR